MFANSASLCCPLQTCPPPNLPDLWFFCSITWEKEYFFWKKVSVTVADSAALNIMPSLAGNHK